MGSWLTSLRKRNASVSLQSPSPQIRHEVAAGLVNPSGPGQMQPGEIGNPLYTTDNLRAMLQRLKDALPSDARADASPGEDAETAAVLLEPTLEGVRDYMHSEKCKNVVVLAGAGISTAAGIPDFRSPDSGLYSKLHNDASRTDFAPTDLFDLPFFKLDPKPFYAFAKELLPRIEAAKPTLSHYFTRLLQEKGYLLRLYTQNVDGLERAAGVEADKIVNVHGSLDNAHCLNETCTKSYDFKWVKDQLELTTDPRCTVCGSGVKPDLVFFGEQLPISFFNSSAQDFSACDLLIVMGTSLKVEPIASVVHRVRADCPRLFINRTSLLTRKETYFPSELAKHARASGTNQDFDGGLTAEDYAASIEVEALDSGGNSRDVEIMGECDEVVEKLCTALGWMKDLRELAGLIQVQSPLDQTATSESSEKGTETEMEAKKEKQMRSSL